MMDDAQLTTLLERIKLPDQDLRQLSFCASKPDKVAQWVQNLPMTRVSYVCSLLYQALPEIARLKISPEHRLEMLESLRPAVHQAIQGLSQQFLNQPVILPEPARKAATVAQALQKHMTNAYLTAVCDISRKPKSGPDTPALQALAIHRGITGLGLLLLRSYQLYTPFPARLWNELHALYLLADGLQLLNQPVTDPLPHHEGLNNIELSYQRLLMLACAHPNQLRQEEVTCTYHALENLVPLARLIKCNPAQKDNLFAVALDSNRPPMYKSRLPEGTRNLRELDTSQIVAALEAEKAAANSRPVGTRNRYGLLTPLTDHLIKSWKLVAQRNFERRAGRGNMDLTVGLSNLHYHLSGKLPFQLFLNQSSGVHAGDQGLFSEKRPLSDTKVLEVDDPWGNAFDVGGTRLAGAGLPSLNIEQNIKQRQQQEYQGEHPTYAIPIVDVSMGGYCLEWRDKIPSQVKAGELLGIKEEGRQKWSLAVVRWMQQTKGATLLGLQTLAPQATPAAAAVIYKTGGHSEYLRALQVPALKAIGQPATLITNAVSFHEYSKVRLYQPASDPLDDNPSQECNVQLTRRRFSTGTISQFEFRELTSGKSDAKGAANNDEL